MYRRLFSFIKPKYQMRNLSYSLSDITDGIGLLSEIDKKLSKLVVREGDTARLNVFVTNSEDFIDVITSYVQEYYPKFQVIIKRERKEE